MDPDVLFVLGSVLAVLSIPAIMSAFADGRAPRAPALIILIGGGMIAYAVMERPNTYSIAAAPDIFAKVISRMMN